MASVYFSKEELARIGSVKGGVTIDKSLMYYYVISPLCARLVSITPSWIAPNVLTVGGLVSNLIALSLVAIYIPNFVEVAPSWVYYALATCVLVYMLLDNMDGKQSVKTGSSSPLGELLDHGCDSVNVSLLNIFVAAALRTGPRYPLLAFTLGVIVFYLPHWQEYFTHFLELGYVNGPTEVECLAIGMLAATGFFGSDFWLNPITIGGFTLKTNDWVLYSGLFGTVLTIFQTLYVGSRLAVKKGHSLTSAYVQLIPLLIFWIFSYAWVQNSLDLFDRYPKTFLVGLNLVFSYLVVNCIIQRICNLPYRTFYAPLLPLILVSVHKLLSVHYGITLASDEQVLMGFFGLYLVFFIHFAVSVATGFCNHLNIHFWTIPYPNKGTKTKKAD